MRKNIIFFITFFILISTALADDFYNVKYRSNYDGDTINFDIGSKFLPIFRYMPLRLYGIDTPEIKTKDEKEKARALKAKYFVKKELTNAKTIDLKDCTKDKYFRLNCRVVYDNKDLTDELLKRNYGYKYFGGKKQSFNSPKKQKNNSYKKRIKEIEKMQKVKLFEEKKVRTVWDSEKQEWYFSVVDVIAVLTESTDARTYWKVLKNRLKAEGNETVTNCNQLKMQAADGKMRNTDVLDTKGILRLIQSIPSPKAEPFKLWLAQVGSERIEEIQDPEKAIDRAMQYYLNKGYSKEWVNQRLKSIEVRKDLTNEWQRNGVQNTEYGFLTDIITKEWSGMTTREYKDFKGLKKESLRDNMSNMELVLNMLAEATTTEISKRKNPKNLEENAQIAKKGGSIAGSARKQIEEVTGEEIITPKNHLPIIEKTKGISENKNA